MVAFGSFVLSSLALSGSVSARRKDECNVARQIEIEIVEPRLPVVGSSSSASAFWLSDFKPGVQWEIVIHEPIKHDIAADLIPSKAKVWDIDMGHARDYPAIIPMLKSAGKFVVCYFNAGALQAWDKDKNKFPKAAIGHSLAYPYDSEEWYLDVRDSTVLKLQKARLDIAVQVGCDAVDPDNVDAWQQDEDDPTGFKLKPSDYTQYLKSLAEYAHSIKTMDGNSLLIGQKNAPEIAEDLVSSLDFAVLESCRGTTDPDEESWPFCKDFQTYIDAGKPVLQIEYPPSVEKTGKLSLSDKTYYCTPEGEDEGFSKIMKWASAQLDGWGQYCGEEPFRTPVIEE
ncbi:endo alpha-1,4 polygalactosaminidase precursor [Fusarium heterosporum]|uniref:alpha-galactosidase n=1 Tax=Fusarium heterosporum TaxID=42747 RepID=A0A8H5T8A0_FUSHE|nr:endo alpha-1,4 polygalactosaminidase precursor [Fusarium heterosporum]